MIITRFLRWCGWPVWTEKEILEELTRMDPPCDPPAPVAVDLDQLLQSEK